MATVKSTLKGINRSSLANNADLIECQELINLRFKDGKWQNVRSKLAITQIGLGASAMCVHNTSNATNILLFYKNNGCVKSFSNDEFTTLFTLGVERNVRFETIGNILIVFDDSYKQMHYLFWDVEVNSYRYLGDAIPKMLDINFSCFQYPYEEEMPADFHDFAAIWESSSLSPYIPVGSINYDVSREDRKKQVLSILNIAYNKWEQSGEANGYVVIRYAYEMYDGSIVGHSSPCLLHLRGLVTDEYSSGMNLIVAFLNSNSIAYLGLDPGKLQYTIPPFNLDLVNKLKTTYKGIIRSLNIYCSRVYHKYEDYADSMDLDAYEYNNSSTAILGNHYPQPWEVEGIESKQNLSVELMIKDTQLYKILSIPIEELIVGGTRLIDVGDFSKIQTNDSMPTDELTNIKIYASSSFIYNSRLWLGNITNYFYPVQNPITYNLTTYPGGAIKSVWFEFVLSTAQGKIRIRSDRNINSDLYLKLPFCLYYPDSRAVQFNILVKPDEDENIYICFSAVMKPHPTFNYSYCFIGILADSSSELPVTSSTTNGYQTLSSDNERMSATSVFEQVTWKYPESYIGYEVAQTAYNTYLEDRNRSQVSSVNNPMYFEAKNSYRVGNGTVLSFMSNARPLTQLQFGQHPMFVFTSTGVFALEIGTGEVMVLRVAPVTDEVITGSPTSYNGNVIFPTDKGIFALYGDSTKLISKALHGEVVSNLANNEAFLALYTDLFGSNDYISHVDFIQYLNGSKLAVDYINEELIVSNPTYEYSYIFNLESKVWSKRSESFKLFSNSWPITYATIERNGSVDLVELGKESGNLPVLIVSRPSGFGSTNDKKIHHATIRTVISGNTGRITGLIYGQLNEEGLIFLNNGKSVIQSSLVDLHLSKTSRSCRYTVLVFGCKPTQLLLDRLDCEVENSWGG